MNIDTMNKHEIRQLLQTYGYTLKDSVLSMEKPDYDYDIDGDYNVFVIITPNKEKLIYEAIEWDAIKDLTKQLTKLSTFS